MSEISLLVTKSTSRRIQDEIRKVMPLKANVDSLLGIGIEEISDVIIKRDRLEVDLKVAYILGSLKGNYNTFPEFIAERQEYNGIPLDKAIKMRMWNLICCYTKDHYKFIKQFDNGYKDSLYEICDGEQASIKDLFNGFEELQFQKNAGYFKEMDDLSYSTWAPESEKVVQEVLKKRKCESFSCITFCL